jgi:hypothetical protein
MTQAALQVCRQPHTGERLFTTAQQPKTTGVAITQTCPYLPVRVLLIGRDSVNIILSCAGLGGSLRLRYTSSQRTAISWQPSEGNIILATLETVWVFVEAPWPMTQSAIVKTRFRKGRRCS